MSLNDLQPGEIAYIASLSELPPDHAKKLLDMGMTTGEKVTFIQRAPLGDPVWIELKGYQLAFRANIANLILVERERGGDTE
jgi:ferrous iron transport protein A